MVREVNDPIRAAAHFAQTAQAATYKAQANQARDLAAYIEAENARLLAIIEAIRVITRQWTLAATGQKPYLLDATFAVDEITWVLDGNEP